ncbi:hypothetical protein TNCV_4783311 [Trichonephila clavipes]|nr:hypothetical protein TNCV_4783311 [Trichonephila clavipes]
MNWGESSKYDWNASEHYRRKNRETDWVDPEIKLKLDGTRATARQRLFPEGWEEMKTLDTLREDCGIIRKQASTDGGVLWKVMCVDVVQVR